MLSRKSIRIPLPIKFAKSEERKKIQKIKQNKRASQEWETDFMEDILSKEFEHIVGPKAVVSQRLALFFGS